MGNGRHEPRAVSDGDGAGTMRLAILHGSPHNQAARAGRPRLPALRDIEDTKADIVNRAHSRRGPRTQKCSDLRESEGVGEGGAVDAVSVEEEAEHEDGGGLVDVDRV
ncbi:hypothetical protein DL768_010107 [Monosporascus sp. mg162]|nr:hypothetical protein DL768_010107 [Monosporascus sp. mg162]